MAWLPLWLALPPLTAAFIVTLFLPLLCLPIPPSYPPASNMFKVTRSPTFTAPVVAHIPADGGRHDKISFTAKFDRMPQTEFDELMDRLRAPVEEGVKRPNDQDIVDRVLVGWGDEVQDEDGNPLPFTPDNVQQICDVHPVRACIVKSFFDHYTKAPAKN